MPHPVLGGSANSPSATSSPGHVRHHRESSAAGSVTPAATSRELRRASAPSTASGTRATPAAASSDAPRRQLRQPPPRPRPRHRRSPPTPARSPPRPHTQRRRPAARATSSSAASTATIAPPAGNACINRPAPPPARTHPPATTPPPHAPPRSHRPNDPTTKSGTHTPTTPPTGTAPPRPRTTPAALTPRPTSNRPAILPAARHPATAAQTPIQHRTHRVESLREHRERLIQLPAHPHPLRTLTREHQRRPPPHRATPPTTPAPARPPPARARPGQQLLPSAPTTTARCSNTARVDASATPHPHRTLRVRSTSARQPLRLRPQRRLGARADTTHGTTGAAHRAGHRRSGDPRRRRLLRGSRGRWCR